MVSQTLRRALLPRVGHVLKRLVAIHPLVLMVSPQEQHRHTAR